MTKDLANKLIAHYEGVIAQIERMGSVGRIRQLIRETHTSCGICMCASEVFDIEIYADAWVNSFNPIESKRLWFAYPDYFHTKPEILEALQFRVNRLKTFKQ